MPQFAGDDEFLKRMRYGDGLPVLRTSDAGIALLVEEAIDVEVKSGHLIAEHQEERIGGTADIEIRRAAVAQLAEVTDGKSGSRIFAGIDHRLQAQRGITESC